MVAHVFVCDCSEQKEFFKFQNYNFFCRPIIEHLYIFHESFNFQRSLKKFEIER